mmetsp:Transcript_101212/g.254938  ORF Transcript_101212/g.254938 Transcript_101212/m.254938 type:complete len:122 (+) Transcript_101212:115-480(+)
MRNAAMLTISARFVLPRPITRPLCAVSFVMELASLVSIAVMHTLLMNCVWTPRLASDAQLPSGQAATAVAIALVRLLRMRLNLEQLLVWCGNSTYGIVTSWDREGPLQLMVSLRTGAMGEP